MPLSPSDLRTASPGDVSVAGRVIEARGARVVIADAFAKVSVSIVEGSLAEGDLAVVEGHYNEGAIARARVVRRRAPARPPKAERSAGDAPLSETERLIARGVGEGLSLRARGLAAIRSFFSARGFLEVETPAIVPCPGLDLHLDAFAAHGVKGGVEGYLITSPEYQMKRLLAGGVPRCVQITRSFRAGEVGRRHNPEFTMLEWYRAFASIEDVMRDTEELVRHVAGALGSSDAITFEDRSIDVAEPFLRLTVGAAFERFAGVPRDRAIALATEDEARFYELLVDAVEPALALIDRPVFLTEYPAPFASLARLAPHDPRVAERFELYVAGVELCNGFGELTDPAEQRARFERDQADRKKQKKPVYPIDERFLAALMEGMPESSGNALGVDRLIAVCAGTDAIERVSAFPVGWL